MHFKIILFFIITFVSTTILANDWSVGVTPQYTYTKYKDSELKNSMHTLGIFLNADYLDDGAVLFGYNYSDTNGKANNAEIEETSLFVSGRYYYYADFLPGKLSLRLDKFATTDKTIYETRRASGMGQNQTTTTTSTSLTDKIDAIYSEINFINFAKTLYFDVAYAKSEYDYDSNPNFTPLRNNQVQQLNTTFGFAFNDRYDWLQTRGYFIRLDHGDNTAGVDHSDALELKWSHWFKQNGALRPHSATVQLLAGKRLFYLDPDAEFNSSVTDLQTRSVAAGLSWRISDNTQLLLLLGYERYTNLELNNEYSSQYLYTNLSTKW